MKHRGKAILGTAAVIMLMSAVVYLVYLGVHHDNAGTSPSDGETFLGWGALALAVILGLATVIPRGLSRR